MYAVSQEFKDALLAGDIQHIKGTITLTNGETIDIPDEADVSKVSIRLQCTLDSDVFMIGQLYTGTLDFVLISSTIRREKLRGGTAVFSFSVGELDEWVPLGIWNITDPQRDSGNGILVKCVDNTSRLDVPINDDTVGVIKLLARLKKVHSLSGLRFEGQNEDDYSEVIARLSAIADKNMASGTVYGTSFSSTCRAEISALAQYIGGIAYINRAGEIAFRKIGDNSAPLLPAEKRFKVNLAEYSMQIGAVSYTYRRGNKEITIGTDDTTGDANTLLRLNLPENPYIWQMNDDDKLEELDRILLNLASIGVWLPGEFDYYGNPAIDLGDKIILTGGVIPENQSVTQRFFIVTGIVWQFRGPQTLISAGAGTTTATTSSGSSSTAGGGQTVVQKPWTMVDLEGYPQTLVEQWREIGAAMFGVGEETLVIAHLTVNLTGSDIGEVVIHVLLDGVMQTEYSWDTIANGQKLTTGLNVPLTVEGGVHRLTIEAKGAATVDRIVASVYGQGVSEYTGETTFDSEYVYHQDIVDEYIGSSLTPRVPAQLGGNDMHILGGGSFAESDIEYAYIPDGIDEIK